MNFLYRRDLWSCSTSCRRVFVITTHAWIMTEILIEYQQWAFDRVGTGRLLIRAWFHPLLVSCKLNSRVCSWLQFWTTLGNLRLYLHLNGLCEFALCFGWSITCLSLACRMYIWLVLGSEKTSYTLFTHDKVIVCSMRSNISYYINISKTIYSRQMPSASS